MKYEYIARHRQQFHLSAMCQVLTVSRSGFYEWQERGPSARNAVAESFFSNLKNELVHHADFSNRESARVAIFSYIELFYNRQRIHQTLGYVSPLVFEKASRKVPN